MLKRCRPMLKTDVWRIHWLVEQIEELPDRLKDIAPGSRHRALGDDHARRLILLAAKGPRSKDGGRRRRRKCGKRKPGMRAASGLGVGMPASHTVGAMLARTAPEIEACITLYTGREKS